MTTNHHTALPGLPSKPEMTDSLFNTRFSDLDSAITDLLAGTLGFDQLLLNNVAGLTIATGAVTLTNAYHDIDTEAAAASDNLDTINGLAEGKFAFINATDGAHTVVLTHNVGNVLTVTGQSISLDDTTKIAFVMHNGTNVIAMQLGVDTIASGSQPDFGASATKTISAGVAAVGADKNLIIAAESGTADDLTEITGLTVGERVTIRADAGDTITVKHNDGGATVKIHLDGDADVILDQQNALDLTLVATNVLVQSQVPTGLSFAILRDEKATTVDGGASVAASWNARDLNTETYDPDAIVSISSDQFTPIAGDYIIEASAPGNKVGQNRLRLYNVTGASSVEEGISTTSAAGDNTASLASITSAFTANGTDAYRIGHYTTVTQATNGLGIATEDGSAEVYLSIKLTKVG